MSTDPGAPVSAEAEPERIRPRPSPKNHTPKTQKKEMTRDVRTVRLNSRPAPIATCTSAKNVFQTAIWGPTKCATSVMTHAMTAGCPCALPNR